METKKVKKKPYMRLSHTSVDTFKSCPKKFNWSHIQRLGAKQAPVWSIAGETCHAILLTYIKTLDGEAAFQSAENVAMPVINAARKAGNERYAQQIETGLCQAKAIFYGILACKDNNAEGFRILKEYMTRPKIEVPNLHVEEWLKHDTEISFHGDEKRSLRIIARPDLLEPKVLIDLKFVSQFKQEYEDAYMYSPQLQLYAELAQKQYGWLPEEVAYILILKLKRKRKPAESKADYVRRLAGEYATKAQDMVRMIRMPVKPYHAILDVERFAYTIDMLKQNDLLWQNAHNCSSFAGCPYEGLCYGFSSPEDYPERKDVYPEDEENGE